MADRPTTPRLDVLIDRACRHLTPAESAALREEVAVLQQRATALDCMEREQRARAERAEQQLAAVPHVPTLLWAANHLEEATQPLAALELRDWAQRAHDGGHTGATGGDEPAETVTDAHTPAQRP